MFQSLETPRLYLRNISEADRDFLFSQFSDIEVNRYLFDAEPLVDLQGADEIIEFYDQPEPGNRHRWIVVRKADGQKIGTCGFHLWNKHEHTVEVGYDLKPSFWGNGYMQEALKAIVRFAIDRMDIRRIDACIYPENQRSIAVVEKLGFRHTGVMKAEIFQGEEYLHAIYSLDCGHFSD